MPEELTESGVSAGRLAGGVNLLMAPDPFIYFCKVHALSPDGTCKTFDASANGYVYVGKAVESSSSSDCPRPLS